MTPDPVPDDVRVELKRLADRWSQLPLDRALRHVGALHAYVVELAETDAAQRGVAAGTEALGEPRPAWVIDQLTAVLFDRHAAGAPPPDAATRLVELRRGL